MGRELAKSGVAHLCKVDSQGDYGFARGERRWENRVETTRRNIHAQFTLETTTCCVRLDRECDRGGPRSGGRRGIATIVFGKFTDVVIDNGKDYEAGREFGGDEVELCRRNKEHQYCAGVDDQQTER
jgi:hypothetical protein